MRPIPGLRDRPVLHRIMTEVFHMLSVVGLIPEDVFLIPSRPHGLLSPVLLGWDKGAFQAGLVMRGQPGFDQTPPSRRVCISSRKCRITLR